MLGQEYTVELREVQKNNGVLLQGLMIRKGQDNVTPTIYLNSFWEWSHRETVWGYFSLQSPADPCLSPSSCPDGICRRGSYRCPLLLRQTHSRSRLPDQVSEYTALFPAAPGSSPGSPAGSTVSPLPSQNPEKRKHRSSGRFRPPYRFLHLK